MELPEDDQPPEEIWLDAEAIANHFDWVRDKYRTQATGDTVADPSMWDSNELTRGLRG